MDGTLTPPRQKMDRTFKEIFLKWQDDHISVLVTGSDYKKIEEQLPERIIKNFHEIYSSMGNVRYKFGQLTEEHEFNPPVGLINRLKEFREATKYPGPLFDNFIETRIGMINFSVLGRNSPLEERQKYHFWDLSHHERESIREKLIKEFKGIDVSLGGYISIDLNPHGYGKEQIVPKLTDSYEQSKLIFIADKLSPQGNDYNLAQDLILRGNVKIISVSGPEQVIQLIQSDLQ